METCRVCRSSDPILLTPCRCAGSMRYIHQECLEEWLKHSKKKTCEICKYKFKFTPIYDENMPSSLSTELLIRVFVTNNLNILQHYMRIWIILSTWTSILPYIVTVGWRFIFNSKLLFIVEEPEKDDWVRFVLQIVHLDNIYTRFVKIDSI